MTFLAGESKAGKSPTGTGPLCAGVWVGVERNVPMSPMQPTFFSQIGVTCYQVQTGKSPAYGQLPACAFGSAHQGGAHFAMCDGSVRFISESIAWGDGSAGLPPSTYNFLGTPADGDVLGEF